MEETTVQQPEQATGATEVPQRGKRAGFAIAAFVFAVAGWLTLPFVYIVSMACGLLGTVAGIVGWRGRRGAWRNLAITSTVAALTLLLVFAVFWGALAMVDNML